MTDEISSLLRDEEMTPEKGEKIHALYHQRQGEINGLRDWAESAEGKEYIAGNPATWDAFLGRMTKIDKENIEKLEKLIGETSKNIKELNLKKALLIYK